MTYLTGNALLRAAENLKTQLLDQAQPAGPATSAAQLSKRGHHDPAGGQARSEEIISVLPKMVMQWWRGHFHLSIS